MSKTEISIEGNEITITGELADTLNQAASETGVGADELVLRCLAKEFGQNSEEEEAGELPAIVRERMIEPDFEGYEKVQIQLPKAVLNGATRQAYDMAMYLSDFICHVLELERHREDALVTNHFPKGV